MNLPVPHVIVAFDKRVLSTFFKVGTNFEDLTNAIKKSDSALLFDSQANPNFISFEHSFGGKEQGNIMTLTLIDPKKEFEERFMLENSSDSLVDYLSRNPPSRTDAISKIISDANKTEAEKKVDINKYVRKFSANLAEDVGGVRPIYLAYGIGTNIDSWSGPHTMMLMGAEISLEGARQITLTFAATSLSLSKEGRRDIHQESVDLNLEGLGLEIDARSHPIDLNIFLTQGPHPWSVIEWRGAPNFLNDSGDALNTAREISPKAYPPYLEDLPTSLLKASEKYEDDYNYYLYLAELEEAAMFLGKIDIHLLITDVIRDLIRKATGNPNVIVVLPNLNFTLAEIIQQDLVEQGLAEAKKEVEKAKEDPNLDYTIDPDPNKYDPAEYEKFAQAKNNLTTWNTVVENNDTYYHNFTEVGEIFYALSNILSGFGINLNSSKKDTTVKGTLKVLEAYRDQDKYESFNHTLRDFLNSRYFTAGITNASQEGLPDYWELLMKITKHISKATLGIVGSNFQLFYESDTRLLDFWASLDDLDKDGWPDLPLFGGVDRVFNSDEGAIVFGDQQLIRDFLYGATSLKQLDARKINTIKAYEEAEDEAIAQDYLDMSVVDYDPYADPDEGPTVYEKLEIEKQKALISIAPFHPLDKFILMDKKYNDLVRKITYGPQALTGAYGPTSYIPDDFLHVDSFSEESRQKLEDLGVPIFRYNTQNPNVLSLKLDNSLIYRNNLNVGFRRNVARRATTTAGGKLESKYSTLPLRTKGDVIGFIRYHERSLGNDSRAQQIILEALEKKLTTAFELGFFKGSNSAFEYAENAYAVYAQLLLREDNPIALIDQKLPGNPVVAMAEFSEKMYRESLMMSITTLPAFNFGTGNILMAPCMLFAQDAPILQTQSEMPESTLLNTFMSGWYNILRYTHKISGQGVSSEFDLVKMSRSLRQATVKKEKSQNEEEKNPTPGNPRKVPKF